MAILLAGDYILELKSLRPINEKTITSVLENAGFNRLVFDSPITLAAPTTPEAPAAPVAPTIPAVPPVEETGYIRGYDLTCVLEDEYYVNTPPSPQPQAPLASPQMEVWRITGRLPAPARLSDLPGLTWKSHKLRVSPNSSLNLTTTPFKVLNGQAYDLKFLSADKRHPTRKHVIAAFVAMGFKPFILAAVKKNARIPGRPNVSMTEWIAVARWIKPSDMILDDKPFHFEDLREVLE